MVEFMQWGARDSTEEEERNTILTVCDPLYGLDAEGAKEVLRALGLLEDPEHTKMNWMGRKAGT